MFNPRVSNVIEPNGRGFLRERIASGV